MAFTVTDRLGGARWRPLALVALLGLAALPPGRTPASPAAPGEMRRVTGLTGRLVGLLASTGDPFRSTIAFIDLSTLRIDQTDLPANNLTGSGNEVIVSTQGPAVAARLEGRAYEPIPGLTMKFVDAVGLSPSGKKLAFSHQTRAAKDSDEIWIWDLAESKGRKIRTLPGNDFANDFVWSGDDRLLVLTSRDLRERGEILEFRSGRLARRTRVSIDGLMLAGPGESVILVDEVGTIDNPRPRTAWLDLRTRRLREIAGGWVPLSWSPDGSGILMVKRSGRYPKRTYLGLASATDPTEVREVGSIRGGLFDGVWQEA